MLALLLATSVVLAYANVRHFEFVNFDDPVYVFENPHVQEGLSRDGLAWAFGAFHSANWHPLTWLSHMLDVQAFGLAAGGHHATSVLLHALASALLFCALRALTLSPWRSAFVAALFALHPRNVESVAWVAERKDVLSAVFWAAALWAYARYARQPSAARYLALALLFVLGLMAKPMVVTLPAVLLLLDVWPLGRTRWVAGSGPALPAATPRALLIEKLPLLALSLVSAVITFEAQRRAGAVTSLEALPVAVRMQNAAVAYVKYLDSALWPSELAAFHPYRTPLPAGEVVLALLVLVALSLGALRTARTRPWFLVGWLWYLGTLLPVIGLLRVGEQAMADRFTYLPLIGVFIAVAWGVADLAGRWSTARRLLVPAGVVVLAAYALATRAQAEHWRDSVTLFTHALRVTERNHVAETNLSAALLERDRIDEAIGHAEAAVRIRPLDPRVHVTLGVARARTGRGEEARASYQQALRLDPANRMAHLNLGLLLAEQKLWEEAGREYGEVLRADPAHAKANAGLALTLAARGRPAEALPFFQSALDADPRLVVAYNGLALALEQLGRRDEAIDVWQTALRIAPGDPRLRRNRAAVLIDAGRTAEAEDELRELIRIAPTRPEGRLELAELLLRLGRPAEAQAELRAARAVASTSGDERLVGEIDARLAASGATGR